MSARKATARIRREIHGAKIPWGGQARLDWSGGLVILHSETEAARPESDRATYRYVMDAKASSSIVQAFATGVLSAFGHSPKIAIRDLSGEVQFARESGALQGAKVRLTIRADSLEVIDKISEKDRNEMHRQMFNDVLEVDCFSEIVYECSQASVNGTGNRFWVTLNGDLMLHGVTRPLPVTARVILSDGSLRASGEFTVRQTDFDIRPVSAAAGTIKLKDELKCTFDIAARKQE
jgi:polyisoprenoid-binding protein YceI